MAMHDANVNSATSTIWPSNVDSSNDYAPIHRSESLHYPYARESSQHIQPTTIVSASSVESPAHASSNLVVCIGGLHSCTIGRVHRGTQEQHLDREARLQLGLGLRTHTRTHDRLESNRISGRRPSISLEIYPCSRCLYVCERVAS